MCFTEFSLFLVCLYLYRVFLNVSFITAGVFVTMMDHFAASMYRHHQGSAGYPTPGSWYGNPYHHQQQQFLSCMHDTPEQTTPWSHHHHHHHMFQSPQDWGMTDLVNGGTPTVQQNSTHEPPEHILPSPPITISGSEISSPGVGNGSSSPQQLPRPPSSRSPYEWMKKSSFTNVTPTPGRNTDQTS